MRLTEAEREARAAFDLLAERREALERHVRRLQAGLAFGNREDTRDRCAALDQASGELVALGPALKAAWGEIEMATPAVRLPPPPPAIRITKPPPVKVEPPRRRIVQPDVSLALRQTRALDDDSQKARFSTDAVLDMTAPWKQVAGQYVTTFNIAGAKVIVKREYYDRVDRHWQAARKVG